MYRKSFKENEASAREFVPQAEEDPEPERSEAKDPLPKPLKADEREPVTPPSKTDIPAEILHLEHKEPSPAQPASKQSEPEEPQPELKQDTGKPAAKRLSGSIGLLLEANMNSPKKYALGMGIYGLIVLPDWVRIGRFSAGLKGLYSYNFNTVHTASAALVFRWNFYDFAPYKTPDSGFFIQAEGGAAFAANLKNGNFKPFFFPLAHASAGYRYRIKKFFIEPYIYAGYPTMWGIGIAGGMRLGD